MRVLVFLIIGCCVQVHAAGFQAHIPEHGQRAPARIVSIDELNIPEAAKVRAKARAPQLQAQAVIQVSDVEITDFDALEAQYRNSSFMRGKGGLAFQPANLDATSLHASPHIGTTLHGLFVDGASTGLSRLFAHPRLGLVVLEETDLRGGGGVTFTRESVNANVNGGPAVLVRQQAGNDRTATILSWFSDGVHYKLTVKPIDDRAREEILAIARGLITVPE